MDDETLISKPLIRILMIALFCIGYLLIAQPAAADCAFIEADVLTDPFSGNVPLINTLNIVPKESLYVVEREPYQRLDIHERMTLDRVVPWGTIISEFLDGSDYYTNLSVDLVLAIIAQESSGMMDVVSSDGYGSCGLMQVTPRDWLPDRAALCNDPRANIETGMWILQNAIDVASENNQPIEYGIAYYNCSFSGVQNGACGELGGLNYADRIMNYWMPLIARQASWCQEQYGVEYMRSPYSLDGCTW